MAAPQGAVDEHVLEKIRHYANEVRSADENRMDLDLGDIESRLDQTIQQLQDRVKEQQLALEQVCMLVNGSMGINGTDF
jgi:hypothetical protein